MPELRSASGAGDPPGYAELRLRRNGFRDVALVPKFDSRGIMNAEGSKCANTPTPARQPVRRRSDMAKTSREVTELPTCPVCHGAVELTPSGYLTCREHGSEHYRVKADDA